MRARSRSLPNSRDCDIHLDCLGERSVWLHGSHHGQRRMDPGEERLVSSFRNFLYEILELNDTYLLMQGCGTERSKGRQPAYQPML